MAQGCPLSCIVYVLAVDPFLEHISKVEGVGVTVGFCDDWSIERMSARALQLVQQIGDEFEVASGQEFNRTKSKILPTRVLNAEERLSVLQQWPSCPIVANQDPRLMVGIHV